MTTSKLGDGGEVIVECALDATPEQVWRALTIPELAADWLDAAPAAEGQPEHRPARSFEIVEATPFSRLTYRWREERVEPTESFVTVELSPGGPKSTWFRLTHRPPQRLVAANSNAPMARAA